LAGFSPLKDGPRETPFVLSHICGRIYIHIERQGGALSRKATPGKWATVRIPEESKMILRELSDSYGAPQSRVLEIALEKLRRQHVLDETNEAYARLRADKKTSRDFDAEVAKWDVTLADGLEDH
jgi:homoserine trans-succinylase